MGALKARPDFVLSSKRLRTSADGEIIGRMNASLERAFGYNGDAMALPVADVELAIPFYERTLGFRLVSRESTPHNSAVLERDAVRIRLVENGGDPTQDGCAFHVSHVRALFDEFQANGLDKQGQVFNTERRGDAEWLVFYVVAPDGLCYWFGERQSGERG